MEKIEQMERKPEGVLTVVDKSGDMPWNLLFIEKTHFFGKQDNFTNQRIQPRFVPFLLAEPPGP